MTDVPISDPARAKHTESEAAESSHHSETEEYQGGSIQAYHGYIPVWLLVVYFVLFLWALYYSYEYWGGLGPGRF